MIARRFRVAVAWLAHALFLMTPVFAAAQPGPEPSESAPSEQTPEASSPSEAPAGGAEQQPEVEQENVATELRADDDLSHAGQIGVALGLGGGGILRVVYDVDENPCNTEDPDNPVCTSGAPLYLDAELSYAFSDGFEVALPVRIALTEDNGEKPMLVIPMIRLWPLNPSRFNLFFEIGLPVMVSPRTDVGAHLGAGLQIDINRMLGVRLGAFPDAFFSNELITTFNFGVGLQGRFLQW